MRLHTNTNDLIGSTVGGYRLERRLGGGPTADVFLGRHVQLGRTAALKVLHPERALDEESMSRFFCEARAVAELGSEHLATVYDFVFEPRKERVAYVMEHLVGEDLGQLVARMRVLPPPRAARIGAQLCDALAAAHAQGVVHRDIRPGNVMLVRRGGDPEFVKLIDFGVAQFAGQVRHHTAAGRVLGHPQYMSPEAARGQRVDGRADLYSVGVLLFELLTGRPPFAAATSADTLDLQLHARPPSLSGDHGAGPVPPALGDIVRRCLQKSPDDRFDDAESLRAALLEVAQSAGDGERTSQTALPREPLTRRIQRRARHFSDSRAAALAFGALSGIAAGFWLALLLR